MAEETIYSDNSVLVTTARVVINGTTYALRNITSVKSDFTPANTGGPVFMLLLGIGSIITAVLLHKQGIGVVLVTLLIAGGLIAGGIAWLRSLKSAYHVVISSSSGEAHALTSNDKSYITKIIASINKAIISQ